MKKMIFFKCLLVMNVLLIRHFMLSYQFNYLSTSILHKIINNLVVVLLKSSIYWVFYKDFNKVLDFPVFLIGSLFPWIWSMNILLLWYLMQSFQFNYLFTSILYIIINNLLVVLLKSSKY